MKPGGGVRDSDLDVLDLVDFDPLEGDDNTETAEARAVATPARSSFAAPPQRSEAERRAARRLLKEILPPLDALESCVGTRHDLATLEEAVRLTLRALWDAFRPYNLERVQGSGMPFDPRVHEAAEVALSDRVPANTVLDTLRVGYLLENELVRPALVRVSVETHSRAVDGGGDER